MSRARPKRRARPPASLRLPHGDPAPRALEPDVEVRRARGRYTSVGYRSARIADREGRAPSRAGAVIHERVDRLRLQFQSREFTRNDGLYRGMLARAVSLIVGKGFKLTCKTGSRRWNRRTEKAFAKWWKCPDAKRELSGLRFERMIALELLTCGDLGVIPVARKDGDCLQAIEAEQIIGRNWLQQGVDRDQFGAPLRFWVSPYHPDAGFAQLDKARAYDPSVFFYICSPDRPSSVRSTPPCQASFPMLHRISDTLDSEALSRQVQARIALIVNKQTGPMIAGGVGARQRKDRLAIDGDATANYITEFDSAIIAFAKPGETITGMDRTAPGAGFAEALVIFFRLLGLPLGLPLELLLLDWSRANYSQAKGILLQAYQAFLYWQEILIDQFYTRVFAWWLGRRIADGSIAERDDAFEHEWEGEKWPWLDELAEAQAQGEKLDRGLTSHGRVCAGLNEDRDEIVDELFEETVEAIEFSKLVKEKTGTEVPWERFAGLKAPPTPPLGAAGSPKPSPTKPPAAPNKNGPKTPKGSSRKFRIRNDAARARRQSRRSKTVKV